MTDFNLRAARIQLGALLVALVIAILIALGITTGAFVLSFAVQRDLARQALIPEHLTWIFPAIVDSAIFGATIAIVILSKLKVSRWDKQFYIALAVGVVAISILGNAYHAFHAAVAAQATVDSGGVLGFVPLAPAVAAAIAIIPPVLVLAFTHGVGILIKAIGAAHAQYSELVRVADHTVATNAGLDAPSIETNVDVAAVEDVASVVAATHEAESAASGRTFMDGMISAKSRIVFAVVGALAVLTALMVRDPFAVIILAAGLTAAWWLIRRIASARSADAPAETTPDIAPDDVAPGIDAHLDVAPVVAPVAPTGATPIEAESDSAEFVSDQVPAESQTVAQLLAFIDRSDLDPMVKKTAALKINKPHLTFAELAEATNVRAASTAMRRYNRAEDAAIAAGFTIPPLPALDDVAREALESERNDDGRNEGDPHVERETQLVHS
ncbi:MAG: DUF2637 domain-containing protein [Rhodococcus sp.]|uniref:DUF2637 domain-containing protein n=1 Tax=Rhodococcus TaxID=1827 RepID=UPI001AEB61B0|nr:MULTISPECIES: DUF2637 domain-containing protein [Rhodococcus]MBP2521000.1 hypothetical protein [Rhodococcus sp. PvP104]MBY6389536.1 DUF2637 domain-containing protein [Rhodococcus erythropolis]MCW0194250.1 DUF2637 domain-containing protein [Rhodococcus sp. (in: high G+C Gram-positive bacteria)]